MQCLNCGSFHTKSGKDNLKHEFLPLILIAFGTAGLGIVLGLPYLIMQAAISGIRKDYSLQSLQEAEVDRSPFRQFDKWWQEAINSKIEEVNAMTLATASAGC